MTIIIFISLEKESLLKLIEYEDLIYKSCLMEKVQISMN